MATDDPFADPAGISDANAPSDGLTLTVGRNAALTIASNSLIIYDEAHLHRTKWQCCGLVPRHPKVTKPIPFFNILWAEIVEHTLCIQYVDGAFQSRPPLRTLRYFLDKPYETSVKSWLSELLARAYNKAKRRRSVKVLINPFGGTGNAKKIYFRDVEPVFAAARWEIDVEQTLRRGHAVEIAEQLDAAEHEVVACCSGDGLPHEVFNGLGNRSDAADALSRVAVVQLPCGTGNAMSLNMNGTDDPTLAALAIVKGLDTPLDLTSITQGDRRILSFLSQAVGIVAEVDLGTDNLRWMGSARFTYGFFVRIMRKTIWPCELAAKVEILDKGKIREHFRSAVSRELDPCSTNSTTSPELPTLEHATVEAQLPRSFSSIAAHKLGNFYAGNMALMAPNAEFFPAALPADGLLDMITVDGDISRAAAIRSFLAVENGRFFEFPQVCYRKVSAYRIKPLGKAGGCIAIDGEEIPFEEFQAEVHKGLGRTLSRSKTKYESRGVS